MARSQRGVGNSAKHMVGTITPHDIDKEDGRQRYIVKPLCSGDRWDYAYVYTDDREAVERQVCDTGSFSKFTKFEWAHDVCSGCQSKYLAKQQKEHPLPYFIGERYDLKYDYAKKIKPPHGIGTSWKSVYPVIDRNILADADDPRKIVAFIVIDNGWGKSWQIHGWTSDVRMRDYEAEGLSEPKMDSDHAQYTHRYESGGYDGKPLVMQESKRGANRFASKEFCLTLIEDMLKDGHIRTYQQIVDDDAEGFRKWKIAAEERRVEREAAAERQRKKLEELESDKGHIEQAFRNMLGDEFLLSNFNREGVFMAAKLLGIDLLTPKPTNAEIYESFAEPAPAVEDDDDGWQM
jgi:hypothetical protein